MAEIWRRREILQSTAKGDADKRLETLTTIITSFEVKIFGYIEVKRRNNPYNKNGREVQIQARAKNSEETI